jgi:hypothetical protein
MISSSHAASAPLYLFVQPALPSLETMLLELPEKGCSRTVLPSSIPAAQSSSKSMALLLSYLVQVRSLCGGIINYFNQGGKVRLLVFWVSQKGTVTNELRHGPRLCRIVLSKAACL